MQPDSNPPPDITATSHVLIAHEDPEVCAHIDKLLKAAEDITEFTTDQVHSIGDAVVAVLKGNFQAAVVSLKLPGCEEIEAITKMRTAAPKVTTIAIDVPDVETGLAIVYAGGQAYLPDNEINTQRLTQVILCGKIRQRRRTVSNRDNELLENLLANIPDRIYFKDLKSRFIRANQALATVHRVDNPSDLVGKTDFDLFTEEHARPAYEDEQKLINGDSEIISKIEKETFSNGEVGWALTTKMPLKSENGDIIGTFGISHNVTKLHEMEQELEKERNLLRVTKDELIEKNNILESDMALAKDIQLALLPTQYPTFPSNASEEKSLLHFEHRYIPAQAVGGDFFTVIPISDTKAGVLICDAMGHGPRAAMITAIVRALREELDALATSPSDFLAGLNAGLLHILRRVDDPMLCTAFYMLVDTQNDTVEFASAGHPSPIHIHRAKSEVHTIQDYDRAHGPVLGLYPEAEFPSGKFTVNKGDLVLLFTDGLFEVICDDDSEYGIDRLVEIIKDNIDSKSHRLLDVTLSNVMSHAKDGFDDDVCLLCVEKPNQ